MPCFLICFRQASSASLPFCQDHPGLPSLSCPSFASFPLPAPSTQSFSSPLSSLAPSTASVPLPLPTAGHQGGCTASWLQESCTQSFYTFLAKKRDWLIKTTSLHKGRVHMRRRFLNAERRITLASGKWR